jgi:4-hydroxybenzoate polyprenyltransferase
MVKLKSILNLIWGEFVYGGHLHSFGVASIVFVASSLTGVKVTWDLLAVAYLGMHSVYLYNRYKEFNIDFITNPARTGYIKKYVKQIPLIIFVFTLTIASILLYYKNFLILIFAFLLLLMGIFYSEFLKKITKKIVGFKNLFIGLFFSSLIVLLALYYSVPWSISLTMIFIFVFLRVFYNTVFFDIKDIESDKNENLLTLPIVLRGEKLIYFLDFINILSGILIIVGVYFGFFPKFSLALLLAIPYSWYYLKKSKKPGANIDFLSYVVADGEYTVWAFLILLGKIFL